ncbi:hypothetical protein [Acinetobacter sp. WZC-1]|uniref:hypothetical protein n=1 Tax=Acinetobacter sp. WZC-1 TaxID=3459034 RepID=UPI00403DFE58
MKLVKTLLATTFALTAATAAFAATHSTDESDKVVVSTQEQPGDVNEASAAAQPTAEQPATESAAEDSSSAPATQANQ